MTSWNRISRKENDVEILGTFVHAFIHNGGTYFLTTINIYQDGMVDCWGLVNFVEFKQKVAKGWVVTTLPNNAQVSVSLLGDFKATELQAWVKEDEFIKEVADEIERLNGRPTSVDKCLKVYQQFQDEQSESAKKRLKGTYEAVPEHQRVFILQDMDTKDFPIRMVIYGEDENEIIYEIESLVNAELPNLPSHLYTWAKDHLITPKQMIFTQTDDGKGEVILWLVTDHTKNRDSSCRIVYDEVRKSFGLVMDMKNGNKWFMGLYGNFSETINAM